MDSSQNINTNSNRFSGSKLESIAIYTIDGFFSLLITIPLFIIIYRYVPDIKLNIGGSFRIDHILTFLFIFILFFVIIRLISKYVLYSLLVGFLLFIAVNQLFGSFGFKDLLSDYKDLITYFEDNPVNIPFLVDEKMTIRNSAEIAKAIDYSNNELRSFAVASSIVYFNQPSLVNEYGQLIRYFSVFKIINRWNYVNDPKGEDYYAKASETIKFMAGDCDDYAIVAAALIKSIGGEVRLIHTKSHLFPEIKVGTTQDLPKVIQLIKSELFYKESLGKKVYYHLDDEGNVWLNFDYTGSYPGAKFMNERIIGILTI